MNFLINNFDVICVKYCCISIINVKFVWYKQLKQVTMIQFIKILLSIHFFTLIQVQLGTQVKTSWNYCKQMFKNSLELIYKFKQSWIWVNILAA